MCVCVCVCVYVYLFVYLRTLISQHTPSSSSSFVNIPVPDAKLTPTSAKNGAESPKSNLLVALLRKSADNEFVTLLRTLSTNNRRAWKPTLRTADFTAEDSAAAPLREMLSLAPSTTSLGFFRVLYARRRIRPFCNSRWAAARNDISDSCVERAQRDANPPIKSFTLIVCYTQRIWQIRIFACRTLSPTHLADLSSTHHYYASTWLVTSQLFTQLLRRWRIWYINRMHF